MGEETRPDVVQRLRLVDSLMTVIDDSVRSLNRLVNEVHREVARILKEEVDSPRADELSALRREVEQLREGMGSRAVIERAKGILMQAQSLSEIQAFELLNELSQSQRRKLREVAADVVNGSPLPRRDGPRAMADGTPEAGNRGAGATLEAQRQAGARRALSANGAA